jgi:hypothetical protein
MQLLHAANHEDLLLQLPSISLAVPSRADGRAKHHTETYSIVRLLNSMPFDYFLYPLSLVRRERPDFEIQSGEISIGIEHTEAISENAAKEAYLRSQGAGPNVYFVKRASINEPRKSRKELLAEIEADEPGEPWMGDSIERDWSVAMAHFVRKKMEVATRPGFQRLDQNWLLIYDNWPAVGLKSERGISYLQRELDAANPWEVFDRIFVENDSLIHELFPANQVNHYDVNHGGL